MARHSEVLIQGTEVPGLRMIVTVPVDHTWASETAKSIYGFGGNTQYIWRKSWETNQPARRSGGSSSSSGGGGLALFGLIALVIVGGVASGGGDTTPSETPQYTPQERVQTYVPPTPTPSYANPSGPCVTANFEPC
jgi:hypothetical protein